MKLTKINDPFTGIELDAIKFDDKSLLLNMPMTRQPLTLAYNPELDAYLIPSEVFAYRKTLTLAQASEYLEVSRAMVSKLCATGRLKYSKVCGVLCIDWESLCAYNDCRHGAAPAQNAIHQYEKEAGVNSGTDN